MAVNVCASDITLLPIYIDSFCFIKRFLAEIGWWKRKKRRKATDGIHFKHNVTRWLNSDIIFECRFFSLLILFFSGTLSTIWQTYFSIRLIQKINILFWLHLRRHIFRPVSTQLSIDHGVNDYHINTVCMLIMSHRSFSLNVTFNSIWLVTVLLSYGVNQLDF